MTRRVSSHAFSCYRRRGRGNRGSRICLKRPLPAISRQWGGGGPTCRVKPTQSLEFAETFKGEVGLSGMRVVEGDERCEEELGRFCFVLTCMRRNGERQFPITTICLVSWLGLVCQERYDWAPATDEDSSTMPRPYSVSQ